MSPYETIKHYLEAMLAWEVSFYNAQKTNTYKTNPDERQKTKEAARARLCEIFENHVKDGKNNKLADAALATMAVSRPPAYEQTIIEKASTIDCCIETKQSHGFETYFKYSLQQDNARWLIDKLQLSADGKAWKLAQSL